MRSFWREHWTNLFLPTFMYRCMLSDAKKFILPSGLLQNSKRSIGQLVGSLISNQEKNIFESVFFLRRPSNEHSHKVWFKFAKQLWERSKWEKLADDDEECKVRRILHFLWVRSAEKQLSYNIMKIYYHTDRQSKNKKPITSLYHN